MGAAPSSPASGRRGEGDEGYNSGDQVDWMKYPGGNNREVGEQVSYSYDNRMALESLYSQTSSYYYVQNTRYDAAGRVTQRRMGSATGMPANPLLQTSLDYYPWSAQGGRLQTLQSGWYTQTASLQGLAYSYDAVGNVSSIVDANAGGTQTQTFSYDTLDRLTSASASGGTGGLYSESYTYDPIKGNLASKGGLSYDYNDPNHVHAVTHLGGVQKYWYDANGNMTQRQIGRATYNLTYDAENHLAGVSNAIAATFKYDGDGNRVQGTLGGVTTTYIGNYYEWTSSGSTQYYYGSGSQRIAMRRSGYGQDNGLFWLFGDHLGSTSVTANSGGGYFSEVRYKAWGETRFTSGNTPTTFRYTGQRQEQSLGGLDGLYYYGARWYDPALSRWIQPDSIVPDPSNPIDLDRYAFSRNNPLRYTDPSGHWIESAIDIASIGYDIYDISQNGLNWENGLSLTADVVSLILPAVTGGGLLVRVVMHLDDVGDTARATNRIVSLSDEALEFGRRIVENIAEQSHHAATNKHTIWKPLFEKIFQKYDLDIKKLWNVGDLPQNSKHPQQYHQWVYDALRYIDELANGDQQKFLKLYDNYVKNVVKENPWILKKDWWDKYGDEFFEWWNTTLDKGL